jgi:hypothetical protein
MLWHQGGGSLLKINENWLYEPNSMSKVPKKLTAAQIVEKFPAFYGN